MRNSPPHSRLAPYALALCLLPFVPGLSGPFLLDDASNLGTAARAQDTWLSWYQAVLGNESGLLRRPLSNLSFLLNFRLGGHDAIGFKLVNLLLHGLAGMLVFMFVKRLVPLLLPNWTKERARWLALCTTGVWLLHPIQVSTTLYVVQRMTQLSAIGVLCALCVACKFLARPHSTRTEGIRALALTSGFALLGMTGKENAALTPLLLLAIICSLPEQRRAELRTDPGKQFFYRVGILLPIALAATALVIALPQIYVGFAPRPFTLIERLLTQPYVLGHYLSTIFIPDIRDMGLYLDFFEVKSSTNLTSWLGIAMIGSSLFAALAIRKKAPLAAFAVFWFLACHALESTILPLELAFEHRNYLALIGPALLIAWGMLGLGRHLSPPLLGIVIAAVFSLLTMTTSIRAFQWGDIERFIRSEAAHHPNSLRALNSAASLDFEVGNIDAAIETTTRIESLYPNSFWANALRLNIIACRPNTGTPDFNRLKEIAKSNPFDRQATTALISVLRNIVNGGCNQLDPSTLDRFMADLLAILQNPAEHERVHLLRAMLASHENRPTDHLIHLERAVSSNPKGVESRMLLAYYYLNNEDTTNAMHLVGSLHELIGYGPERERLEELKGYIAQEEALQRAGNPL